MHSIMKIIDSSFREGESIIENAAMGDWDIKQIVN